MGRRERRRGRHKIEQREQRLEFQEDWGEEDQRRLGETVPGKRHQQHLLEVRQRDSGMRGERSVLQVRTKNGLPWTLFSYWNTLSI